MSSLVQSIANQIVGTVEEVSAEKILVLLDPEAPQATALNTGTPTAFPRINGYLLIPNEVGATVGCITSVRIERQIYPGGWKKVQDASLVNLPFSLRFVVLTPLGTLVYSKGTDGSDLSLKVHRGIDVFPSVGDPVLLPTPTQLQAIVQGESSDNPRRILIGHSPIASGAPVYVDPDKLFGRHLAVLGTTGSGKSCSVAGLIRWSIEAAKKERERRNSGDTPNVRFIVLDPNGEYATAFRSLGDGVVRLYQVDPDPAHNARQLKVPAWLWNGEEWAAFTEASPGVQRPVLFEALRRLRLGHGSPDPFTNKVRARVRRYRYRLKMLVENGEHQGSGKREGFAQVLLNIKKDFEDLEQDKSCNQESLRYKLRRVAQRAAEVEVTTRSGQRDGGEGYWHNDFSEADIDSVMKALDEVAKDINIRDDDQEINQISEDIPRYFPIHELPDYVEALVSDAFSRDLARFVDFLNLRIRGLIGRGGLAPILHPKDSASIKLEDWLADYIGANNASNGQITVVDLSLVPSDVIHIVVAVLARLTFEALQRYRRENGRELPTVLVLEEAHMFVHRDLSTEGAPAAGRMCYRIFERIAREGRKFGLGLVVASQRPSELSPTVLSQCNTFLLHRIVNDRDQDLVKRLVPDGLTSMLRELPSLPSRRAILLGWAAPAPVLVEIQRLPEGERPHSQDPAFWDVWTGDPEHGARSVDWNLIAQKWTENTVLRGKDMQQGSDMPGQDEASIALSEEASEEFADLPF